jgi:hypothetical protein
VFDDIPETPLEQARMIENILVAACEGDRTSDKHHRQLRGTLLQEPRIKALLPSFVRTCRDLNHLWSNLKGHSGQWKPRRVHVRAAMTPLIDYLEGSNRTPADPIVSASKFRRRQRPQGLDKGIRAEAHRSWTKRRLFDGCFELPHVGRK